MARKRHSAEDIVNKLREAEVLIASGTTIAQVCKQLDISGIAEIIPSAGKRCIVSYVHWARSSRLQYQSRSDQHPEPNPPVNQEPRLSPCARERRHKHCQFPRVRFGSHHQLLKPESAQAKRIARQNPALTAPPAQLCDALYTDRLSTNRPAPLEPHPPKLPE